MKKSSPLPSDTCSRSTKALITTQLFDKLAFFAITFGSIATIASIARITQFGWKPNIICDTLTYVLMVIILLTRRYISPRVIALHLMVLLSLNAFCNIIFAGYATASVIMLCSCGVVTGTLFGFRSGQYLIGTSTVFMIITAFLYVKGILTPQVDPNLAMHSMVSWLSYIAGFFVFSLACLTVVHFIKDQLVAINHNLTQRSNELHVSERKFRLLAENMHDVLLLLDTNLMITYISPSVEKLTGYSQKELTNRRIDILVPIEKSAVLLTFFSRSLDSHSDRQPDLHLYECPLSDKHGVAIPAEFSPSPTYNSDGEMTGIQCIIRNLTAQKKAEEEKKTLEKQLRHSEKLEVIGQLAGGIAHDFNNQLAGILGFAELIKAEQSKDSEVWSIAQSIASIAKHSSDLTGKLLAFARKGNNRVQVINIHKLIDEISGILSRSIDRNINITNQLDAPTPYIKGDPGQLQNALLNIALNARDAMLQGGTLSFSTRCTTVDSTYATPYQHTITPGDYIHITVSDTGSGIDDDTKQHLFEPFFTTKAPGKGTGMGLAAVYGTIQTHGGILNVTSAVDEGTSFHIYLPACKDTPDSIEQDNSSVLVRGKGKILVIEDEKNVSKMMEMVLKHLGYTVEVCTNGNDGLAVYKKSSSELTAVIIDLILPGMSGKDLLRGIRSINAKARILICSGYRADINIQKLIEDTQTLFIQKPFAMNELSAILGELLQLSEIQQQA